MLRKLYRADLVQRRGERGLLGAVVAKEWLWLQRNPWRSGSLALGAVLLNAGALLVVLRASRVTPPSAVPGFALFGVSGLLLLSLAVLLEPERLALWDRATVPRPSSWLLVHKTLFMAGLALAGGVPIVIYTSRFLTPASQALPALLYAATCITILAVCQTAFWLRRVTPNAPTSLLRHGLRILQLCMVAGVLATGFSVLSAPTLFVPRLAVIAAFALTSWHGSAQRLPFVLDPTGKEPAALTSTYALTSIFVTRILQVQLLNTWLQKGMPAPRAAALSLVVAGVVVLLPSLLWLRYRAVTGLRERLGLVAGKGGWAILREGLLWSVPATAINLGYWALLGPRLVDSGTSQQAPMMTLLAGSGLAVVGVGCVAAPLIEELLFRGMFYRSLRSSWGIALSLLVSSVVFAVDHSLLAALPVFCASVCMTLAFERSRSLYAAVLTHAVYNGILAAIMLSR